MSCNDINLKFGNFTTCMGFKEFIDFHYFIQNLETPNCLHTPGFREKYYFGFRRARLKISLSLAELNEFRSLLKNSKQVLEAESYI